METGGKITKKGARRRDSNYSRDVYQRQRRRLFSMRERRVARHFLAFNGYPSAGLHNLPPLSSEVT